MTDQPTPDVIQYEDFLKLDLRVGTVVEAVNHPNADKLLLLKVDMGGGEQRQICAGIREFYAADQVVGKQIIIVANLAPRKVRGELSQGMLLAASNADHSQVILLTPDSPIAPGSKVS